MKAKLHRNLASVEAVPHNNLRHSANLRLNSEWEKSRPSAALGFLRPTSLLRKKLRFQKTCPALALLLCPLVSGKLSA